MQWRRFTVPIQFLGSCPALCLRVSMGAAERQIIAGRVRQILAVPSPASTGGAASPRCHGIQAWWNHGPRIKRPGVAGKHRRCRQHKWHNGHVVATPYSGQQSLSAAIGREARSGLPGLSWRPAVVIPGGGRLGTHDLGRRPRVGPFTSRPGTQARTPAITMGAIIERPSIAHGHPWPRAAAVPSSDVGNSVHL